MEQLALHGITPPKIRRDFTVEIMRPRICNALARFNDVPVRILCATNGGGKTTALRQYAEQHSGTALVTLPYNATEAQVAQLLANVAGASQVVVDCADIASPAGLEALFEDVDANFKRGRRYLLAGSSRTRMEVQPQLLRGTAELFDASFLSFSNTEISELAAAHGVAADQMDIEQLKYDTDGWPVVVSWIIRDAARNAYSLRGAFERWHDRNGHLLVEFVELAQPDSEWTVAFMGAIRSVPDFSSQRVLERLDAEGYPIVRMRASVRPYRPLMRLVGEAPDVPTARPVDDRMVFGMFGRFSCKISNRPVIFARRRDQNLLAFVALARGASVTRTEVLKAFWPEAPAAVASQGLRTALSRLRRAITEAAGCDASRYLRSGDRIEIDLDHVSIDVLRFADHIERARLEEGRGNRRLARGHYGRADSLYANALLSSEALEPAFAPCVAEYSALFELVLVRLVEMCAQDGDVEQSQAYARRLSLISGDRERRQFAVQNPSSTGTA